MTLFIIGALCIEYGSLGHRSGSLERESRPSGPRRRAGAIGGLAPAPVVSGHKYPREHFA